ncbi:MAG: helicase-related protein [Chloroflexota bacterium]
MPKSQTNRVSKTQPSLPSIPPPEMGIKSRPKTSPPRSKTTQKTSSDIFIVDNSDTAWKVCNYLSDWCELSSAMDIASGYFEIGALLALEDNWHDMDHIRILMGDEVSFRTKRAFEKGLERINIQLDNSLENEKNGNEFLAGVSTIVKAIQSGQIECRVYRKDKFHAKAYITHGKAAVIGSFALVGSSNFTYPGLHDNVELNVQIRGPEVGILQEWYEHYWDEAEDVTPHILRTLERQTQPHTPFEIWFKSLDEFFRGRELEPDAWDENQSIVFKVLDKYQRDAYRNLMQIANRFGGAFLCDGVGLGKTYVGLMLIERLVFKEAKQVVLFAPKAAREDVWEPALNQYLQKVFSGFVNLVIYNHTDLGRAGKWQQEMEMTINDADVVIIDEAHHFRNPGIKGEGEKAPSRYRLLQQYLNASGRPKQVFFLTATPINNSIHDFRHTVELFTNNDEKYFAPTLGIHSLRSHFIRLEKNILGNLKSNGQLDLLLEAEIFEAERMLRSDKVFDALVVQRSRSYVKESQRLNGGNSALFPERELPKVVGYDLKSTYGSLLDSVSKAFHKEHPLFVLGIYYPLKYPKEEKEKSDNQSFEENRQKQVVMLIRTLFLKRFESSAKAFEGSCWRLMIKLLAWATVHAQSAHDKHRLERWKSKNAELIGYVQARQQELWPTDADEDEVEALLDEDMLNAIERLNPHEFDIDAILDDTFDDLEQLADFLKELGRFKPQQDDKLKALIKLLKTDAVLKDQKVIIFTEYADTARYLEQELTRAGISGLQRIDGSSSQNQRSDIIRRFSPYYNGMSTGELAAKGKAEIRVLISTDVLSEGLNLQDATRLINYDLHWNPVRLMQRIGRVDRRMNPKVEEHILADHPELKDLRGKVAFWNFLPPDELDKLLELFKRVTNKVLVISRTFGIEGRSLLGPNDEFDPIKEINEQCDGVLSEAEQLRLEYIELLRQEPDLAAKLATLPLKVFSGRVSPDPDTRAVFFCYRIPRPDPLLSAAQDAELGWSDSAGFTVWLCYDLEGNSRPTEPGAIASLIRSLPDTERRCALDHKLLSELRKKAEKQLISDYLKPLQAPIGVAPILKCWMELN